MIANCTEQKDQGKQKIGIAKENIGSQKQYQFSTGAVSALSDSIIKNNRQREKKQDKKVRVKEHTGHTSYHQHEKKEGSAAERLCTHPNPSINHEGIQWLKEKGKYPGHIRDLGEKDIYLEAIFRVRQEAF